MPDRAPGGLQQGPAPCPWHLAGSCAVSACMRTPCAPVTLSGMRLCFGVLLGATCHTSSHKPDVHAAVVLLKIDTASA